MRKLWLPGALRPGEDAPDAERVDADGGWPLELLLPNRTVAEVYTQPGEIILYEGAWLRHGRPMRFKGDEFANVFSHFAPPDWHGAHRSPSESRGMYHTRTQPGSAIGGPCFGCSFPSGCTSSATR